MTGYGVGPGTARGVPPWRDLRWRDPGWIAFLLNRLTGVILVLYLLAHFVVLSGLRVIALTLGVGTRHATALFVLVLVISAALTGAAGWAILLT